MIFDTHAHYDDSRFDEDRREVIKMIREKGVGFVTNIGSSLESCKTTVELAEKYDFMYGAVGVHPSDTSELKESDIKLLEEYAKKEKIVAIGEIGLDYYYDEPEREHQKKWFVEQLRLAKKQNLPVVIHSRDAAKDTLDIMRQEKAEEIGGVIHCYSYGWDMAKIYIDMGFYLGVGGVVTFKNGKKLKEVVSKAPIDRIVLETDSPYLTPEPNRGKRNDSHYLSYVAEEIAQIKGITKEEVIEITTKNAFKMYRMYSQYL